MTTDTRGPFGEGARKDGNSIFIFEAGAGNGHLGHLHQIPSDEQYAAIGRLDVVKWCRSTAAIRCGFRI